MVVILLFGLTLIAVIAAKDLLKGLLAGFFGLMIGVIGTDHVYNTPRATLGFLELYDGVPLVPALIGLFAISEALVMVEEKLIVGPEGRTRAGHARWADTVEGLRMALQRWWHIVWTSFVACSSGSSPVPVRASQRRRVSAVAPVVEAAAELYGTGIPERVIARKRQQRGTSGTLVPTLALGVPAAARRRS